MPVNSFVRLPADKAQLMEVIYVQTYRGSNFQDDPVRMVQQYWRKDGTLLAEFDDIFESPDSAAHEMAQLRRELASTQVLPDACLHARGGPCL